MLLSRLDQTLLRCSRGPFLSPDDGSGGGSGGGDGAGDQGKNDANANNADSGGKQEGGKGDEKKIEFNAEQQKHIDKLIGDARKDAARVAGDKAKADRDAADAQATKDQEAADAKAKGDFATVEKQLGADLETAKTEATSLKTENDQLREAMKAGVEAGWKEFPESIRKVGEKQHPENDVLGRWTFLHDADTAALVKELSGKDTARGNGRDPKPNASGGTPELKSLISKQSFLG